MPQLRHLLGRRGSRWAEQKSQWLEETGGFRFGETDDEFRARTAEIGRLREQIKEGKANAADVSRLAHLLGTEDSDID